MTQPFRLPAGGLIDRERALAFRFNGREFRGHPGDTLASALLANGVRLVARSFKYHRPRGMLSAGVDEPNALVQLGDGARSTPNLKATEIALFDGLVATSVNVYPSVGFDLAAAISLLSRFMPAGFYYKTFFASPWLWQCVFEPLIRRASGWGRAPATADPDCYVRMHAHCDVLVVGAGPSGIMAATVAAAGGARVILADESDRPGGSLLARRVQLDGMAGGDWAEHRVRRLEEMDEVRVLPRTTVTGYYDGNYLVALELAPDESAASSPARPRQRLWHIRAREVVLATGAQERPLVFANNDRPGIMLASAVQACINRWAVMPGRNMVLFTNNDRAYECALDAHDAGVHVAVVVDSRAEPESPLVDALRRRGVDLFAGHVVCDTAGRKGLREITVAPLRDGELARDKVRRIACDLLAVSGGRNPAVHLHSQARGRLDWVEAQGCFRPAAEGASAVSVGGSNASFALADALAEARDAGARAAAACGFPCAGEIDVPACDEQPAAAPEALWLVPDRHEKAGALCKHFVDLQNDTSAADIVLSAREGFESVEHMKRYTLTGFGTDQGKVSNVNGLAILASTLRKPIPEVGTTTFRPPYTPVTFAAMGGRDRGALFEPARLTAMHDRHVAADAVFEDVGQWKRPWYYPRAGEDMHAAVARECAAVREAVGVLDASTLGKIDLQGRDVAEFLNRVYTNRWLKLGIGRARYGLMCREDGMVFDDGTTARIGERRWLMTTTTGGAAMVLDHLEEYLQTEWPDLDVRLTSVTEQWSVVSIAGPRSRDVLRQLAPGLDLSPDAFPFLSVREAAVSGIPARIFRISFTGELQYEINVPWHYGAALWDVVMRAGEAHGITPYGTETMHVLRAEKGFIIAGQDTDGQQTPQDLGLGWAVKDDADFIGRRSHSRSNMLREDRLQLVGLLPEDPQRAIPEGTQLVAAGTARATPPVPMQGFVTSSYWSAVLGRHFCLALVSAGRRRIGEKIEAALPEGGSGVTICEPCFYDPENARRDG